MTIEKISGPIQSARFTNLYKELVDMDFLFVETNKFYSRYFYDLGTVPTFDFSDKFNQNVYINEFIKIICDFIKKWDTNYKLFFYCNSSNKDNFRNKLIKKVKSLFGFKILEDVYTLDEFVDKVKEKDCSIVTNLEIFLHSDQKLKSFKQIKKNLQKLGLVYLNDVYFEELNIKMSLLR